MKVGDAVKILVDKSVIRPLAETGWPPVDVPLKGEVGLITSILTKFTEKPLHFVRFKILNGLSTDFYEDELELTEVL